MTLFHVITLVFSSFLHSLFNGRNCLFFVFVGNADPKTEMEDTNTDTILDDGEPNEEDGSCVTIMDD